MILKYGAYAQHLRNLDLTLIVLVGFDAVIRRWTCVNVNVGS